MKIRLVPKKKPTPAKPAGGQFAAGVRVEDGKGFVDYDTRSDGAVKVYLFDELGHFIADSEAPAGTLCIPTVRLWTEEDPHVYRLFVRLADGSESIEDVAVSE